MAMPMRYIGCELALDMAAGAAMDLYSCASIDSDCNRNQRYVDGNTGACDPVEMSKMKASCWEKLRTQKRTNEQWGDMALYALKYGLGEATIRTMKQAAKKRLAAAFVGNADFADFKSAKKAANAGFKLYLKIAKKMGSVKAAKKLAARWAAKALLGDAKRLAISQSGKFGVKMLLKAGAGPVGWALMIFDLMSMGVDMIDPLNLNDSVSGIDMYKMREEWIKGQNTNSEKQYKQVMDETKAAGNDPLSVSRSMFYPYGAELLPNYPPKDELGEYEGDLQDKIYGPNGYVLEYLLWLFEKRDGGPPPSTVAPLPLSPEDNAWIGSIDENTDFGLTDEDRKALSAAREKYNELLEQEWLNFNSDITQSELKQVQKKREQYLVVVEGNSDKRKKIVFLAIAIVIVILIIVFMMIFF